MALQQVWRNYLCGLDMSEGSRILVQLWDIHSSSQRWLFGEQNIANISIRQATAKTSANYQPELQQDAKQNNIA